MNIHISKKALVLGAMSFGIFIAVVSAQPQGKREHAAPKNLKVLPKDIDGEELHRLMRTYNTALGVRCNFCHAPGADGRMDFASDANEHKEIARSMMRMTADINKKYFNYGERTPDSLMAVNCYTCHHGQKEPANAAFAEMGMEKGGQPAPPPLPHKD